MFKVLFDTYERKARLYPALIVLAPIIIDIYLIIPEFRDFNYTIITILISLGLLDLLAHISRVAGKRKEKMLFKEWNGAPATRFLRHSDNTIDKITKKRYHLYFFRAIPLKLPSLDDENEEPEIAELKYESSIKWLREKTSDKKAYPLIFKENTNYGFSRNLWALKPLSIVLLIISITINITINYLRSGSNILEFKYEFWIALSLTLILLLVWVFFINKGFVKTMAESYAIALLSSCDK